MNLKTLLEQTVNLTSLGRTKEDIEKENLKIECKVFDKCNADCCGLINDSVKGQAIPRFYFKIPRDHEKLAIKFREESRAMFLQRRSRELLDSNELNSLWILLDKHHSPPYYADEQFINYKDFLNVAALAGQNLLLMFMFQFLLIIFSYNCKYWLIIFL